MVKHIGTNEHVRQIFSAEELKRIPLLGNDGVRTAEWAARVQGVHKMITNCTPTDSAEAQAAAKQWFEALERDIEGDPRLVAKLTEMHMKEPTVQAQTGITPEVINYLQQASTHAKLAIYAKYLSPNELAYVRANYGKRMSEWPTLIAAVRQEMDNGTPSDAPVVRKLALHWLDIFRSYAGDNPDTQLKIRNAHAHEPELMAGSLIDEPMLVYMRAAFAQLRAG